MEPTLKSYLSFTGLALLTGNVQAQMVYTDIVPDVNVSPPLFGGVQSYMFDPDQDGIADFEVRGTTNPSSCYYSSYSYWFVTDDRVTFEGLTPGASIRYASIPGCNAHQRAYPFSAAQLIQFGPTSGGLPLTEIYMSGSCYCYGFTATMNDRYFGFRFLKNGVPRLGWIRFTQVNQFLILKDYAYCDTTVNSLPAGVMNYNVGLSDISSAFSFNCNEGLLEVTAPQLRSFKIEIFDLLGKLVDERSCMNGHLSYAFAVKGVFIAKVTTEQGVFSKKLFVY